MASRTYTTVALRPPPPAFFPSEAGPPSPTVAPVTRRVQAAIESLAKSVNDAMLLLLLLAAIGVIMVDIYTRVEGMSERAMVYGAPSLRRAAALVLRGEQEHDN